jgi:predicted GNAT superfamily acetyltransferase
MLAVMPEYRRAGLGRRLKLEQRREALERDISAFRASLSEAQVRRARGP